MRDVSAALRAYHRAEVYVLEAVGEKTSACVALRCKLFFPWSQDFHCFSSCIFLHGFFQRVVTIIFKKPMYIVTGFLNIVKLVYKIPPSPTAQAPAVYISTALRVSLSFWCFLTPFSFSPLYITSIDGNGADCLPVPFSSVNFSLPRTNLISAFP